MFGASEWGNLITMFLIHTNIFTFTVVVRSLLVLKLFFLLRFDFQRDQKYFCHLLTFNVRGSYLAKDGDLFIRKQHSIFRFFSRQQTKGSCYKRVCCWCFDWIAAEDWAHSVCILSLLNSHRRLSRCIMHVNEKTGWDLRAISMSLTVFGSFLGYAILCFMDRQLYGSRENCFYSARKNAHTKCNYIALAQVWPCNFM